MRWPARSPKHSKEELDPFEDLNADGAMRKHLAGVLVKRTLGPLATG